MIYGRRWGRLPRLDTGVGSTVATRLELEAEIGPTTCSREQSASWV